MEYNAKESNMPSEVPPAGEVLLGTDMQEVPTGFQQVEPQATFIPLGASALGHRPDVYASELSDITAAHDGDKEPIRRQQPEGDVPYVAVEKMAEAAERAAEIREKLMVDIGKYHDGTGIDKERIKHFGAALGLQQSKEMIITYGQHIPAIRLALVKARAFRAAVELDSDDAGAHFSSLGLTIVNREQADAMSLKYVVSHEDIGHGSVGVRSYDNAALMKELLRKDHSQLDDPAYVAAITGAMLPPIFEESFAHIIGSEFDRFDGNLAAPHWHKLPEEQRHVYNRYGHYYNAGAIALALLCERQPDLLPAIIEQRADAQITDVKGMVDGIKPGLYKGVAWLKGPVGFNKGLHLAMQATGISKQEIPDICNNGRAATYIRQRVEAYQQASGYDFSRPDNKA